MLEPAEPTLIAYPFAKKCQSSTTAALCFDKLDGVGLIDHRPFTDKLHNYVKKSFKKYFTKEKRRKKITCDT